METAKKNETVVECGEVLEMNPAEQQEKKKGFISRLKNKGSAVLNAEIRTKHVIGTIAGGAVLLGVNELVGFLLRNKIPWWPKLGKYTTAPGTNSKVIQGKFAK